MVAQNEIFENLKMIPFSNRILNFFYLKVPGPLRFESCNCMSSENLVTKTQLKILNERFSSIEESCIIRVMYHVLESRKYVTLLASFNREALSLHRLIS